MTALQPGIHCITLWPEWAHAVCWLGKPIENRPKPPWAKLIGERVGIHAGAYIGGRKGRPALSDAIKAVTLAAQHDGWDHSWLTEDGDHIEGANMWRGSEHALLDAHTIITSAVVCTAVLAKVENNETHWVAALDFGAPRTEPPWADPASRHWWHLADVEVLAVPVPAVGKQGFWRWSP